MKKLFTIGMAALLPIVLTLPAAAKVKIGGIVFTDAYYLDRSKENAHFYYGSDDNVSYTNTRIEVPTHSRFYVQWTNEDNVGMHIELGFGNGNTVGLRKAYGWWDVNSMFQLMAGKSTTPFSPLYPYQLLGTHSGSHNIGGKGYGEFYSGRFAQVRGTFKFGKNARLVIALVDPNGKAKKVGQMGPWNDYQTNTKIPRIDIGVPIYVGPAKFYPTFLYQHRTVDNTGPGNADNDLDTYIASLGVKAGFGPFVIAAEGNYGNNWANTRGQIGFSPPAALAHAVLKNNGQINDANTYGFWFDISYKFGLITPHLIYGQMKTKNENSAGAEMEAKSQMWGVSIPIDLAKGFRIRPELMWYDDGDTSTAGSTSVDNGKYGIYGLKFEIRF